MTIGAFINLLFTALIISHFTPEIYREKIDVFIIIIIIIGAKLPGYPRGVGAAVVVFTN